MATDKGLCQMCAKLGRDKFATEVDHVIPKVRGGTDHQDNLQSLCHDCHVEKSRAERGFKARRRIGLDGYPVGE